ncbi:MAG: alpha-methylacyl-CoA racemase [Solirubrobacteraceae bacterium]|nr:alpha-methylacyl-CoA racemase [Solirubrobacteraceae bacterium]
MLELAGIGPSPFTAMLLADMGADVLRVDRKGSGALFPAQFDPTRRGRAAIAVDLKHPEGVELVLSLAEQADALIEGYRPGVLERLGLGPDDVRARNPRLVYGRMTGYGQDGPMSTVAGHDINYISLAGALGAMARKDDRPLFPLNLVGDYGGGGMLLAFGVVCGLLEARGSGQGQVVDAAMVEGSALLTALFHGMRAAGAWNDTPGTNLLDSGAHFYEVYRTADGGHVAVGAIEPQFYARLLELLELSPDDFPQFDMARWPEFKERFAALFATRTRDDWAALLEGEEACATAVYGLAEAPQHPHNVARETFVELDGMVQPNAAPRFDRTPGAARPRREDPDAALAEWGDFDIAALRASGALG